MEIIIVNDGSADGTAQLCHVLASENDCIHVITQKTLASARPATAGWKPRAASLSPSATTMICSGRGHLNCFCRLQRIPTPTLCAAGMSFAPAPGRHLCRAEASHRAALHNRSGQGRLWCLLENSGPQFVWNALYRRTALLGLRFNERCSFGLEDFVFNAAAYRRICKAVYIPQVVYRHFEGAQSTSCARTAQALMGRIRALEPWMEAEFHAAQRWCSPTKCRLWGKPPRPGRDILMHQLRDARAPIRCVGRRGAPCGKFWPHTQAECLTFCTMQGTIKSRRPRCSYTSCGCKICTIC